MGFGAPLLTKKKMEEEGEDDISNLKRLSRDCFSDLQQLREKVHRLEANQRNALRTTTGTTSGGIFHRVKAKVEAAVAPPFDDGFNVTASNRMKRGTEVKVNCETHFPKIGCVLTSGFNAEGGKMFTQDGQELHAVTVRKVSYKISNAVPSLIPDGVTLRITPLGFEGRDQFASLSPIQENASLTGFGSTGASYCALGDGDSAVSVGCEVSRDATVNLAMCAGNNTRVDEPTARVIGQGSWRSKRNENAENDGKKKKKNVNYAGALGGSVDANGDKIASVSVAAAIEDVVVSAWMQKDVLSGGGGKSFSKSKSKRGRGGGGGSEDVFEWGVVATKPPSAKLKPATATLKDILSPKNLGWGCVFGHSSAVGGEHMELFARIYGDGFQKPSMSVFPGIVVNRDERGKFDTAFGMRAHWYL